MNEKMISLDQIYERLEKKLSRETRIKKESNKLYECSLILLENFPKRIEISQSCWKFLRLKIHRSQTKEKEVLYPLTKDFYDFLEPLLIQFLEGNRLYSEFPEGEKCTGLESIADVTIAGRMVHKTPHEPSRFFISLKKSDNIVKMKNLIGEPDDLNEGIGIWYFGNKVEMEILMRAIEYNKISKRRKEKQMKKIEILKETRIPGTNVILESGDKILYKEAIDVTDFLTDKGIRWSYQDGRTDVYSKVVSNSPRNVFSVDVYKSNKVVVYSTKNPKQSSYTKPQFMKDFDSIYAQYV